MPNEGPPKYRDGKIWDWQLGRYRAMTLEDEREAPIWHRRLSVPLPYRCSWDAWKPERSIA